MSSKNGFTKVTKGNVTSILAWGITKEFRVCASNKKPDDIDAYTISSNTFKDTASFLRWHIRIKKMICNDVNGLSLNYYIIK